MALFPRLSPVASLGFVAVALGLFWFCIHHYASLAKRLVVIAALVAMTFAVFIAPRGSGDIWSYISYGRIVAVHHESPYTHAPRDFPNDPLTQHVTSGWQHVNSVYGPLFTGISADLAQLAGDSPTRSRILQQALEAIAITALAFIVYAKNQDVRTLLYLCLNPALIAMVNGGHNDVLMGTLIAVGLLLLRRAAVVAAGVAIAAAISIKATALIAAVVIAVWLLRRQRKAALKFVGTVGSITIITYLLAGGIDAIEPLLDNTGYTSRSSLISISRDLAPSLQTAITVALFGLFTWWFIHRTPRPTPESHVVSTNNAFIFSSAYVLPWYCGWTLPAAALIPTTTASWIALVQSSALLLAYTVPPGVATGPVVGLISAIALPASLVAAWAKLRR